MAGVSMSPLTLSSHRHWLLIRSLQAKGVEPLGRSDHFAVYGLALSSGDRGDDIVVVHDFMPAQIDNNIGSYVADELLPLLARAHPASSSPTDAYAYSEQETFERYVGAIVRSVDGNERRAWHRFYDNTLAALRSDATMNGGRGNDFIRSFRAIYDRVAELVTEITSSSILDVATCFGFLPLFLASRGNDDDDSGAPRRITGCDLNAALIALAEDYRRRRRLKGVNFLHADILAAEAEPDLRAFGGSFEVVTAIHFLEHLAPEDTAPAMAHLWALTGRRLIIAVPFEAEPDPRFGHRQVFDRERLAALGRRTGGYCRTFEHHGGWLIADRR
jgi:2-polyprenyl-3-methyl-5-hydroxy-6-metoxy-1,4-benzoquinol methylase